MSRDCRHRDLERDPCRIVPRDRDLKYAGWTRRERTPITQGGRVPSIKGTAAQRPVPLARIDRVLRMCSDITTHNHIGAVCRCIRAAKARKKLEKRNPPCARKREKGTKSANMKVSVSSSSSSSSCCCCCCCLSPPPVPPPVTATSHPILFASLLAVTELPR